tara:strand:- start:487 stop:1182 length:696 start_codon:yes stop_codon:yes gene_type:complete
MSFLKNDLNKRIQSYVKSFSASNLSELQLLEPFSIIIKLAIISYKEENTKIAINNNNMFIQSPTFYQGIVRYLYGNNREDICFLLKPIMRSLELYSPDNDNKLKYIFKKAILGLSKLKTSYNNTSSTVCHSLDLYISIIDSYLEGKPIKVESYNRSKDTGELNFSVSTKINLEKIFTNIWSDKDINLLYSMFNTADDNTEVKDTYLKSINNLVKSKKPEIDRIIEKTKNFL